MSIADPVALKALVENSGVAFRQTTRSYVFNCPRCGKKDKLMMFKKDGRFICWVCAETSGFKGRPEYALVELLGDLSIAEIRKALYGSAERVDAKAFSLSLVDFYADAEEVPADVAESVKGRKWPLDHFPIDHQFSEKGRAYLLSRGVSLETARKYDIRYCPPEKRVIIPVKIGEKLVGWQARAIFPTEWVNEDGETRNAPKILTTGPRDNVVMFQDNLMDAEHVIVCEGPFDALKCDLVGGAIATMGKVISPRQLALIKGCGARKIYVALDLDAGTEAMKLAKEFGGYSPAGEPYEVYRLTPAPGYGDIGDMPPELVIEQIKSAERINSASLLLNII